MREMRTPDENMENFAKQFNKSMAFLKWFLIVFSIVLTISFIEMRCTIQKPKETPPKYEPVR